MSLASTLNFMRPTLATYIQLTTFGLLRLGKNSFELCSHPKAPPLATAMASAVIKMGASATIEAFCMSRMLAEGPKVFTFDALACEALENFDLSVATADYLQPFPTIVIELPADFTKWRVVPFEEGAHAPDFAIVHHDSKANCVLLIVRMTSHQVLTRLLKLDLAPTLEEVWDMGKRTWGASDSLAMTSEENDLGTAICKLALNVCLMATAYGVRCLGPSNPSHHERLKRHARLAQKQGQENAKAAKLELLTMPQRYAFEQEVVLYRKERQEATSADGEPTGRVVAPHWRRGHWRSQPFGTGRLERKRIAIPSVLVNGHLFAGSTGDTQATYRLK